MLHFKDLQLLQDKESLAGIPSGKVLVNTINAFSFNTARRDAAFRDALLHGDYLIPDGASVVKVCQWLGLPGAPRERIAGWDLFDHEMNKLNQRGGKVLFMGSSIDVLTRIKARAIVEYPNVEVDTYSPPYKPVFSAEDNAAIVSYINQSNPDLLWIGMTAPKQEKWAYEHWQELDIHCHCGTIGAVFDFFAGTARRAPLWWQQHGLEWLYRLKCEPRRMWRRYIIGNTQFICYALMEKIGF